MPHLGMVCFSKKMSDIALAGACHAGPCESGWSLFPCYCARGDRWELHVSALRARGQMGDACLRARRLLGPAREVRDVGEEDGGMRFERTMSLRAQRGILSM